MLRCLLPGALVLCHASYLVTKQSNHGLPLGDVPSPAAPGGLTLNDPGASSAPVPNVGSFNDVALSDGSMQQPLLHSNALLIRREAVDTEGPRKDVLEDHDSVNAEKGHTSSVLEASAGPAPASEGGAEGMNTQVGAKDGNMPMWPFFAAFGLLCLGIGACYLQKKKSAYSAPEDSDPAAAIGRYAGAVALYEQHTDGGIRKEWDAQKPAAQAYWRGRGVCAGKKLQMIADQAMEGLNEAVKDGLDKKTLSIGLSRAWWRFDMEESMKPILKELCEKEVQKLAAGGPPNKDLEKLVKTANEILQKNGLLIDQHET